VCLNSVVQLSPVILKFNLQFQITSLSLPLRAPFLLKRLFFHELFLQNGLFDRTKDIFDRRLVCHLAKRHIYAGSVIKFFKALFLDQTYLDTRHFDLI
jgi:hypothetical protein